MRSFEGTQGFYKHRSTVCGGEMRFSVFVPDAAKDAPLPVVYFLAGLTCTEETFAAKSGAQRAASKLGLIVVTCDTSPRSARYPGDDEHWDFGQGAGFYVDATEAPWSDTYRMETYVTEELRTLVETHFPIATGARGIFGHSMGGHGALTLALRHPDLFRSCSAFAPIAAPMRCPWGTKAFGGYLGPDKAAWAAHDATMLVQAGHRAPALLIDQGEADQFLAEQLLPHRFEAACRDAGQPLRLRRHAGYDHGYYFIASFIADHVAHHARALRG